MHDPLHLGRRSRRRRSHPFVIGWWSLIVGLAMISTAAAQYGYDPAGGEASTPGIHYFGAAKDDDGSFLPGATIALSSAQGRYVFVTNDVGRFRGNLPIDLIPEKITPQCFKAGFELVRIATRPGPAGAKASVQLDCILRPGVSSRP